MPTADRRLRRRPSHTLAFLALGLVCTGLWAGATAALFLAAG